jgi:hypothetical protein
MKLLSSGDTGGAIVVYLMFPGLPYTGRAATSLASTAILCEA